MDLFAHIFYTLVGVHLVLCFIFLISKSLGKFVMKVVVLAIGLAVASIIIMGCWALIIFLSGVIM